jgi:hypothetical protein
MNLFSQWLFWHFFEAPRGILRAWRNYLKFYLEYFSVLFLLRTLFSPWRKYQWSYGRGFDIGRYFEVFFSNLISRILGATLRIFLIMIGILVEIFIIFLGTILFLGWLILPILLLFLLGFSFKMMIK